MRFITVLIAQSLHVIIQLQKITALWHDTSLIVSVMRRSRLRDTLDVWAKEHWGLLFLLVGAATVIFLLLGVINPAGGRPLFDSIAGLTGGTILTQLLYESWLGPKHNDHLADRLREIVNGDVGVRGAEKLDAHGLTTLIAQLNAGQEFLWLATLPLSLAHDDVCQAIIAAVSRGVKIRILFAEPSSPAARFQAYDATANDDNPNRLKDRWPRNISTALENARKALGQSPDPNALTFRMYSDSSANSMYLIALREPSGYVALRSKSNHRGASPSEARVVEAWTSQYLGRVPQTEEHLHWLPSPMVTNSIPILDALGAYFQAKWDAAHACDIEILGQHIAELNPDPLCPLPMLLDERPLYIPVFKGYYSQPFLAHVLGGAKRYAWILAYRNRQMAQLLENETILGLCAAQNLVLRILCVSSRADRRVLERTLTVLPDPENSPVDTSSLVRELRGNERRITELLATSSADIRYESYDSMIGPRFVIVDGDAYLGFDSLMHEIYRPLDENPGIKFDRRSEVARMMRTHFLMMWPDIHEKPMLTRLHDESGQNGA
jgi:hypothetical protein